MRVRKVRGVLGRYVVKGSYMERRMGERLNLISDIFILDCHIEFSVKWCLLLSSSCSGQIGFSKGLQISYNDSVTKLLSSPIFHRGRMGGCIQLATLGE